MIRFDGKVLRPVAELGQPADADAVDFLGGEDSEEDWLDDDQMHVD